MAHHCHAIQCERTVPPAMFMCRDHWYMVPKRLRGRIWKHYRPGQEDDWEITRKYADAAKLAIKAVAAKEGIEVTGEEMELVLYDFMVDGLEGIPDKVRGGSGKGKGGKS